MRVIEAERVLRLLVGFIRLDLSVRLRSAHCIVGMLNGTETTFSYRSGRHRSILLGDNAFVQTVPFHVSR